jgi:hypothetical protein
VTRPLSRLQVLPGGLQLNHVTSNERPVRENDCAKESDSASPTYSGPKPPRSWTLASRKDRQGTEAWRTEALSVMLNNSPCPPAASVVPPLTLLCLRRMLACLSEDDDFLEIVPYLPPHLRQALVRDAAQRKPFSIRRLAACFECHGAAGEMVIMGPAELPDDWFSRPSNDGSEGDVDEWDAEEASTESLHTLIVVSSPLSTAIFLSLPPTITHLGLINVPTPLSLYKLPGLCPLIVVLDLSYNKWLSKDSSDMSARLLERTDWSRWRQLSVLAFRGCVLPDDLTHRINKGRWDDVRLILE